MLLAIVNIIYILHILFVISLFLTAFPVLVLVLLIINKGRVDDAFRGVNWMFGHFLTKMSWPLLRIKIEGQENLIRNRSSIIVLNHLSMLDIFFSSMIPVHNQLVFVRNWVFKLKPFGWAMRLAHYPNIDETSFEDLKVGLADYVKRQVSFQIYPEGHRSKDGRLNRFHKGAFALSIHYNLPVVPVCVFNAHRFISYSVPFFHPVRVKIKILPPVFPGAFTTVQNVRDMTRAVKNIFEEQLSRT
jgi:1-acyl-sn-glycerol-3-phosphate acyltransferase